MHASHWLVVDRIEILPAAFKLELFHKTECWEGPGGTSDSTGLILVTFFGAYNDMRIRNGP